MYVRHRRACTALFGRLYLPVYVCMHVCICEYTLIACMHLSTNIVKNPHKTSHARKKTDLSGRRTSLSNPHTIHTQARTRASLLQTGWLNHSMSTIHVSTTHIAKNVHQTSHARKRSDLSRKRSSLSNPHTIHTQARTSVSITHWLAELSVRFRLCMYLSTNIVKNPHKTSHA
jgi:hypothetical protein